MPWTVADVEEHKAGLSDKAKKIWVRVANATQASCEEAGKADCDASAIKQANAAAKGMQEGGYVLFEAEMSDQDVRNALEQAIKAALPRGDNDGYVWVADVYDTTFVYEDNRSDQPGMYRRNYTMGDDGAALLGEPVKVTRQTVYVPVEESGRPGLVQRALDALTGAFRRSEHEADTELRDDFTELIESSVRADGTMPIKIIAPGWGNSGYYGAELLERDGPKVYKRGTQMYLDHPTATEDADRPERSLRDLVGTLASDGRWEATGSAGPGIYADAAVAENFRGPLGELAPHIGISHRMLGEKQQGEAEGREGSVIQSMAQALSVDFVTKAAAGGKVLQLMESARARLHNPKKEDPNMPTEEELKEAQDGRAAAEKARETAEKERDELKEVGGKRETEFARLQEVNIGREAKVFATEVLAKVEHLPELTQARLVESMSAKPPVKDGALDKDTFTKALEEAAKAEIDYLAKLTESGTVKGMGGSGGGSEGDGKALKESWHYLHPDWTDAQIETAISG